MLVCTPCQKKKRLVEWISANPDRKKESRIKWTAENKEKDRLAKAEWEMRNKKYITHRAAIHRAKKRGATPAWADRKRIREIYEKCPPGFQVDHIIPLNGELVTGLHVDSNLQYLPASENRAKSNKFLLEGNP